MPGPCRYRNFFWENTEKKEGHPCTCAGAGAGLGAFFWRGVFAWPHAARPGAAGRGASGALAGRHRSAEKGRGPACTQVQAQVQVQARAQAQAQAQMQALGGSGPRE